MTHIPSNRLAGFSENRAHLDFYPTPEWATEALFTVETFTGSVIEPACGAGDMLRVILRYNSNVVGKDIVTGHDYMSEEGQYDHVITNPPFKLALQFVNKSKQVASHKIALFLKLSFLEGQRRQTMLRDTEFPLARVHVFSSRVTFHPNGIEDKKRSGTMAFAWFVWDKSHSGPPMINWL